VPVARRAAVILRWCGFTGLAGAVLAPFAILLLGQGGQVAFIPRPGPTELAGIHVLAWPPAWAGSLFTLITVVIVGVWGTPGARNALVLGLAWGLTPP
jgi:hypothetical protein